MEIETPWDYPLRTAVAPISLGDCPMPPGSALDSRQGTIERLAEGRSKDATHLRKGVRALQTRWGFFEKWVSGLSICYP